MGVFVIVLTEPTPEKIEQPEILEGTDTEIPESLEGLRGITQSVSDVGGDDPITTILIWVGIAIVIAIVGSIVLKILFFLE